MKHNTHPARPENYDESAAIRAHHRQQTFQWPDDALVGALERVNWLLARADAGALDGDLAATTTLLEWQKAAILNEQAERRRVGQPPSQTPRLIDRDLLDRIKANLTIVDLLERHGVTLRRSGTSYRAACPFCHAENRSTLAVYDAGPRGEAGFHCYRCGSSGDVIAVIRLLTRCTFLEAVSAASVVAGIELEDGWDRPPPDPATPPIEVLRPASQRVVL